MKKELTKRLYIKFNEMENHFELLMYFYDFSDELYPLSHIHHLQNSTRLEVLKYEAKRKYPDIYDSHRIENYLKRREIL